MEPLHPKFANELYQAPGKNSHAIFFFFFAIFIAYFPISVQCSA